MCYLPVYYLNFFDVFIFFFKQKTAYEMRISDWSSDVCSSDLFVADIIRRKNDIPKLGPENFLYFLAGQMFRHRNEGVSMRWLCHICLDIASCQPPISGGA